MSGSGESRANSSVHFDGVPVTVTQLSDFGRCLTDAQPVVPIRDSAGRASTFEWHVTAREQRCRRLRGRTRKDVTVSEVDRSKLPIRRETFDGIVNRTLDGSQPDWNLIGHPTPTGRRAERPAGPHRRCRIREPEHVRRPDPDTELHPRRRGRAALQPVPRHRAVLSDARGAVDRAEQPRGRVRIDRRVRGRVPGLLRDAAAGLRAAAADPARQRLQHGRVREVASDTRRSAGSGRAVRPVAERLGLRLLLRDPRRWLESVGSGPGGEPEDHRHRPAVLRRGASVLLPGCDGRPHDRVVARRARRRTPTSRSSCTSRPDAATHHTTSRRNGPTSTRGSSTRDGTSSARRRSRARRSSESFPPTPSSRRATRRSRRGTTFPTS